MQPRALRFRVVYRNSGFEHVRAFFHIFGDIDFNAYALSVFTLTQAVKSVSAHSYRCAFIVHMRQIHEMRNIAYGRRKLVFDYDIAHIRGCYAHFTVEIVLYFYDVMLTKQIIDRNRAVCADFRRYFVTEIVYKRNLRTFRNGGKFTARISFKGKGCVHVTSFDNHKFNVEVGYVPGKV